MCIKFQYNTGYRFFYNLGHILSGVDVIYYWLSV